MFRHFYSSPGGMHARFSALRLLQEDNLKEKFGEEGVRTTPHGHGVPQRSAQDSVYYHPVNNPSGAPPPGRPQRYRDDVDLMDPAKADEAEAALRARMRAQPEAASSSADASAAAGAPCFVA